MNIAPSSSTTSVSILIPDDCHASTSISISSSTYTVDQNTASPISAVMNSTELSTDSAVPSGDVVQRLLSELTKNLVWRSLLNGVSDYGIAFIYKVILDTAYQCAKQRSLPWHHEEGTFAHTIEHAKSIAAYMGTSGMLGKLLHPLAAKVGESINNEKWKSVEWAIRDKCEYSVAKATARSVIAICRSFWRHNQGMLSDKHLAADIVKYLLRIPPMAAGGAVVYTFMPVTVLGYLLSMLASEIMSESFDACANAVIKCLLDRKPSETDIEAQLDALNPSSSMLSLISQAVDDATVRAGLLTSADVDVEIDVASGAARSQDGFHWETETSV